MPTRSFILLGANITQSAERGALLEWLETNGLGDFACGTVAGPNTRREHGLFSAAAPGEPPMLLLAALEATLQKGSESFPLSCQQYVGARHPEGYRFCTQFACDPFPSWRFQVPGGTIVRRIFMPQGIRAVVVSWTLEGDSDAADWRLRVRPLFAFRRSDALTHANPDADMSMASGDSGFSIAPYRGCPRMYLRFSEASILAGPCWYYRFQHTWDIALGLEGVEDHFSPCEIIYSLAPGKCAFLLAGVEPMREDGAVLQQREIEKRSAVSIPEFEDDRAVKTLMRAARAFVVRGPNEEVRIVAGYPSPEEDLRFAAIALPGVLLCTRRLREAADFLEHALALVAKDLAAPGDEPLWLLRAAGQYLDYSRDWDFLRDRLYPAAEEIVRAYVENASDRGYRLAPDGLLASQGDTEPLTWMNAAADEWLVTPRTGKPVEVNALWHHALGLMVRWSGRRGLGSGAERFSSLRDLCAKSFRHRFWNPADECLFDVVDTPGGRADASIRPNQLFAVSLSGDLLDRRQASAVLSLVEKRLLTPFGLRTLSLEDAAFQPRYAGAAIERAGAKHQGSVHPWLIGAYVDAVFRVHGRTPRACARAQASLERLLHEHLADACLGQVSELFHGAAPHLPQGAFAHAPAVGELLRAYLEVRQ